ncbi:MAG: G8 domain-containing protein [Gammaproteobacteria bacterium]
MAPASATVSFGEIWIANGGTLVIPGQSANAETKTVAKIRDFCITDGGILAIGRPNAPVTDVNNGVVLDFVGDRSVMSRVPACKDFAKGIDVTSGGSLLMYGTKGVPETGGVSWTTLAAPAGINVAGAKVASTGTKTLQLTADVTKGAEPWQPGNWIVVATTSYTPFDTEFVQVDTVTSGPNGGSTVTLLQPLKHYHFGSLAPSSATATCPDPLYPAHSATSTQPAFLCDGPARNYGVDERAEVGLISRDITLTADTAPITPPPPPATTSEHWGGEIMIHAGFKQVAIQGVRLSKFGKDKLGSYPIHFHMVGDAENMPIINADSVDHSYNHCVTIHETSNLTISNLVCARIVGQIFYQELGSYDEDNVADDSGIVFKNDLGIGAMSNSFDIYPVNVGGNPITRQELINRYWWTGDYMTNSECGSNCIGYDGFNIPDTGNQAQLVNGSCTRYDPNNSGSLGGYFNPLVTNADGTTTYTPCSQFVKDKIAYPVYIEPANGFWIQNPKTVLEGNAIAGCQGVGRGFWWVMPGPPIMVNGVNEEPKFFRLGKFGDNRASACYSGFYAENEYSVHSDQLFPHALGIVNSPSIIATLDGMTATRNRFRGVWLRPVWFAIKDGHFASNRENVSMVTSGGLDGNAPGVWDLLENSVVVGYSQNNVGRWGPCPRGGMLGGNTGGFLGCVDHTPPPIGETPHSGAEMGQGYEEPNWNDFGYMLYDGPVRVFHDRFVNFNYNSGWTSAMPCSGAGAGAFYRELDTADCTFLKDWETHMKSPTGQGPPTPYEGDAAFGWFQSNQSAYPTGTASKELIWVDSNLRHQIYTDLVSVNTNFNDGDKNTAIIDEDGTLAGLGVQLAPNAGSSPVHVISLNNLPFNATSNSVDECLSRGGQNAQFEGRDSSLMSPASMGTLEFSDLYPFLYANQTNLDDYPGDTNSHWQDMIFTRDDQTSDGKGGMFHPDMTMQTGRNGLGIWEPKVANGYGYTVTVAKTTSPSVPPSQNSGKAGIWKWIDVGLADVVDPNISARHPFFIQLGICYTNANGTHPADSSQFVITRGYKSYVGGNTWQQDPELLKYWTPLDCNNLDANNKANIPWHGNDFQGTCPSAPTTALNPATAIGELTNPNHSPDLKKFYYNPTTGMLYLNVAQVEPNPVAPSPTGSCANGNDDPSCPDVAAGESYYACPKEGCPIYTIAETDPNYVPGPSSNCTPAVADLKPAPANQNKLVVYGTNTVIQRQVALDKQGNPYYTATNGPMCTATEPQP